MQAVTHGTQYIWAKRPIQFTLSDGREVTAMVCMVLTWGVHIRFDALANSLLAWLEEAQKSGKASVDDLIGRSYLYDFSLLRKKRPKEDYAIYCFQAPFSFGERQWVYLRGHYIYLKKPV